jgi:putative ABC transport system substrate-binding protein
MAATPIAAIAQPAGGRVTIGFIGPNAPDVDKSLYASFIKRLGELGWSDATGAKIDYRATGGAVDLAATFAAEFVRLKVDVIVAGGDAQVLAARKATTTIPIVFGAAGDPVGNRLVASLARPGGNVTGLSLSLTETAGKRAELLREIVPDLRQMAILGNFGNPTLPLETEAARAAAREDKIDTILVDFGKIEDVAPAIEALKGHAQALYVCADPITNSNGDRINALALAARLPVMYSFSDLAKSGGTISYGPDRADMFRRAAEMVDKILRGAKPADIPVEQPTKFTLLVNLKTARSLGLTIPPLILARADVVIE